MPLQSITHAASRSTKLDGDITPAELPSGRVRFSDELGRETALVSRREQEAPERAAEPASDPPPRDGEAEPPRPPAKAPREARRGDRKPAASAPEADDELALALAELGLSPPLPAIAPPPPPAPLDPAGTGIVAKVALATPAIGEATARETGDVAPSQFVAAESDSVAPELAPRLLAGTEKSAAREAPPDSKLARAEESKAASAVTRLLGIAAASHAAAGAGRTAAAETTAVPSKPPASEPALPLTPESSARVALADLPRALPALLDEAEGRVRFGRRGSNWEVELRLDPPELGSLRIRFELHGDSIRGVIHGEPRVERLLGPVLKELEEELGRQGGAAAFDLSRRAREQEEQGFAPRSWRPRVVPASLSVPRDPSARSDPSRLVDVTA